MSSGSLESQRLMVICQRCGKLLGHIINYGKPGRAHFSLPCPCGGSSPLISVAAIYKPEPNGILGEQAFGPGIERALEAARVGRKRLPA